MHDATALAAAIAAGHISAAEVMEATLTACSAQADLGAVVYIDAEMARAEAAAADAVPHDARGLFHGIPILMKDLGAEARGLPAAAGSTAFRRQAYVPETDSDLASAFRAMGLIPFGLTATPPFGLSLTCLPDGLPSTRNPWDLTRTPGGSSGGASAAVAAGIVALAHATDAAGSIRVPAACCGLTGLKPSRGAVPGGPTYNNHLMGIASEFLLARSVRDIATAFGLLGSDDTDLPDRPRIGLALPDRCDSIQRRAAEQAATALQDAGCVIRPIAAPDQLGGQAHDIALQILSVSLADWLAAREVAFANVPPLAATHAAQGRAMSATKLFALTRAMQQVMQTTCALFQNIDAILMPVLAQAPLPFDALDLSGTDLDAHFAGMESFAPNAAIANVAGLPALALPFGVDSGLPLGVQLMGPPGTDARLLNLGALVEARAPALTFPGPIAGLPI
ncbi:amidase [Gymnodinialimonas sp. 2305UL16-5]|uniref:amidase n=1 Tax=Gymnodinialimonas mytili TaxID=3126503 RepID=UPI0030AE2BA8